MLTVVLKIKLLDYLICFFCLEPFFPLDVSYTITWWIYMLTVVLKKKFT